MLTTETDTPQRFQFNLKILVILGVIALNLALAVCAAIAWKYLQRHSVGKAFEQRGGRLTWGHGLDDLLDPPRGLYFRGEQIDDDDLRALEPHFAELSGLWQSQPGLVCLYRTRVSDDGLAHLKALRNIGYLQISNCGNITDAGLMQLKGLPKLYTLQIENTGISLDGLIQFKSEHEKAAGRKINVNFTVLGHQVRPEWRAGKLISLEFQQAPLFLSSHPFGDADLVKLKKDLEKVGTLERLTFHHWHITDAGLAHFYALTSLRELDLTGTPVTAAGIESLRKALPRVTIRK